ncbi:hypothetical protein LRF89_06630 [Halorhodospira sp. 9621]|uniref:hypothetical protein n=1 Tax=Halorhodospira sp. 9621 TaxID=2899135 RepID=UPI001EE8123C|nr:hypothetical protein [Halorhodospira sp. 9621]MCG5533116.1 hypothetical protein [Halorhodospira sp. 9621]
MSKRGSVVHLVHGAFNKNASGWDALTAELIAAGCEAVIHDYGWVGPLTTRRRSRRAGHDLATEIGPEDHVVAFSNGALVCWEALEAGMKCDRMLLIQPALTKYAEFGPGARSITVLYNRRDFAVQMARLWAWVNPVSWAWRHHWGAMGRYGPQIADFRVVSIDTERENDTTGHTAWREEHASYWLPRIVGLIEDR